MSPSCRCSTSLWCRNTRISRSLSRLLIGEQTKQGEGVGQAEVGQSQQHGRSSCRGSLTTKADRVDVDDTLTSTDEVFDKRSVSHYNQHRPHRALQLRSPRPDRALPNRSCSHVVRRQVLGDLINEYEPAAA
jgi:hypothetical protein